VDELGIEPGRSLQELERAILRHDPILDQAATSAARRSILVASASEEDVEALLELAVPLAVRPPRELILARPLAQRPELGSASAVLLQHRERLIAAGLTVRAAAFTTDAPGRDLARLAAEGDVDLLVVAAPPRLLDDPLVAGLIQSALCDVGVLVGQGIEHRPVLVPFGGAEHDWSAVEIGAWFAAATEVPLQLAGSVERERDASRLLARASPAVQRALGVPAEPLLVEPGTNGLLNAAEGAGLVVAGLSERWRTEGLGPVRSALATRSGRPLLLVRRGLRPGGLAPQESQTRFTWSLTPSTS
jgi:hypothetical protein